MTSLSLEEIVKWGIAIIVAGTVFYLIFIHFNPTASEQFWGKINNATGFLKIGQEKLDYEFEMPKYMEDNVETINETIFLLKDKNIPIGATQGEIIKQSLELKDFQGCELTVMQDYKGDLKLMIKNVKGQIKYYKTYTDYSPCIVDLRDNQDVLNYQNNNLKNINIRFVEKIDFKKLLFPTLLAFKGEGKEEDEYEGYYKFLEESPLYTYKSALVKIGENICFVGQRIDVVKE